MNEKEIIEDLRLGRIEIKEIGFATYTVTKYALLKQYSSYFDCDKKYRKSIILNDISFDAKKVTKFIYDVEYAIRDLTDEDYYGTSENDEMITVLSELPYNTILETLKLDGKVIRYFDYDMTREMKQVALLSNFESIKYMDKDFDAKFIENNYDSDIIGKTLADINVNDSTMLMFSHKVQNAIIPYYPHILDRMPEISKETIDIFSQNYNTVKLKPNWTKYHDHITWKAKISGDLQFYAIFKCPDLIQVCENPTDEMIKYATDCHPCLKKFIDHGTTNIHDPSKPCSTISQFICIFARNISYFPIHSGADKLLIQKVYAKYLELKNRNLIFVALTKDNCFARKYYDAFGMDHFMKVSGVARNIHYVQINKNIMSLKHYLDANNNEWNQSFNHINCTTLSTIPEYYNIIHQFCQEDVKRLANFHRICAKQGEISINFAEYDIKIYINKNQYYL